MIKTFYVKTFIYLENLNVTEGKCGTFIFVKWELSLLLLFLGFFFKAEKHRCILPL